MRIDEKCSCGAALTATAKDQVELGFVRMQHSRWLAEHNSCVARREREAYPAVSVAEGTGGRLLIDYARLEEVVAGWIEGWFAKPENMDGIVKAIIGHPVVATQTGTMTGTMTGASANPGQATIKPIWSGSTTTTVSTSSVPVPKPSTQPPKISPRTQEEMDRIGQQGLVKQYAETAKRFGVVLKEEQIKSLIDQRVMVEDLAEARASLFGKKEKVAFSEAMAARKKGKK